MKPSWLVASCLATVACHSDPKLVGPCNVAYDEPLFTIENAKDAATKAPISRVVLRSFLYDRPPGPTPGVAFLTDHFGLTPKNVTISGNELLCDVVCSFGAGEGGYVFTFGATGYRDTTFAISDAKYSRARGGCPTYLSGGVTLGVELTPK